jgi:hypothetical protein
MQTSTPPRIPPPPIGAANYSAPRDMGSASDDGQFNMGKGIAGAVGGAVLGAGLMYGFTVMTGFRFPLLGVGIGALTGYGAKLLFRGTDHSLGVISAVAAAISVIGTLFAIYGEFPIISIISVAVSVSFAYRIASS